MVCALIIKKVTSFSLEEEAYMYVTETVEWMWIYADFQLFDLNLLILVTAESVSK